MVKLEGVDAPLPHALIAPPGDVLGRVNGEDPPLGVHPHGALLVGLEDRLLLLRRQAVQLHAAALPQNAVQPSGGRFLAVPGGALPGLRPGGNGVLHSGAPLALRHGGVKGDAQAAGGLLIRQDALRRPVADPPVPLRLLSGLPQKVRAPALLRRPGVVAVGARGHKAAHQAGGGAHQEIIEGVLQVLLRRADVSAVNAGHLPVHPVADELLQTLAHRSGAEGQGSAQHSLPRFRRRKAVHRLPDAPLHGIVQSAAAIRLAEGQRHVEHPLREDFLCGGGGAVEHLALVVRPILAGLLGRSAKSPDRKRSQTQRRPRDKGRQHVQGALGQGGAGVHQDPARPVGSILRPLQIHCGALRQLVRLLIGLVRHRLVLPLDLRRVAAVGIQGPLSASHILPDLFPVRRRQGPSVRPLALFQHLRIAPQGILRPLELFPLGIVGGPGVELSGALHQHAAHVGIGSAGGLHAAAHGILHPGERPLLRGSGLLRLRHLLAGGTAHGGKIALPLRALGLCPVPPAAAAAGLEAAALPSGRYTGSLGRFLRPRLFLALRLPAGGHCRVPVRYRLDAVQPGENVPPARRGGGGGNRRLFALRRVLPLDAARLNAVQTAEYICHALLLYSP